MKREIYLKELACAAAGLTNLKSAGPASVLEILTGADAAVLSGTAVLSLFFTGDLSLFFLDL